MSGEDSADFWKISDNPSYGFMWLDGNYIWITLYDANEVKRFNILTGDFDANFTSINKPLGICGTSSHIFVAEYGGNFIIAIDKINLAIRAYRWIRRQLMRALPLKGMFGGQALTVLLGLWAKFTIIPIA